MELQTTQAPSGPLLVRPSDAHLDAGNVQAFKDAIAPLLAQHARIVFDMSALSFVDSSGLGALIACLRETHRRGGDFRLCAMTRPVNALFELMRMHRVFNVHASVEDALAAFA